MKTRNFVSLFVLAIALLVAPSVSAGFGDIQYVEIDGVHVTDNSVFGIEAGQTLDMSVVFSSFADENDVRVTARVLGVPGSLLINLNATTA